LRVLQVLLNGEQSTDELTNQLDMPLIEVMSKLSELRRGGYVQPSEDADEAESASRHWVASPALREPLARLLVHAARPYLPQHGIGSRRVRPG
jgi:hypothetical protein